MADFPLFDLTAAGKFRLAYDRLQWVVQRGKTAPRNDDPGYRGTWFVGRKKHTLLEGFARSDIELTPEAQRRFDALPDTFDEFYAQIREPRLDISGVRPPVEGGRYFDHASPGPLPPPNGEIALGTVRETRPMMARLMCAGTQGSRLHANSGEICKFGRHVRPAKSSRTAHGTSSKDGSWLRSCVQALAW